MAGDLFPVQVLLPSGEIKTFLCVEDAIEVIDETGGSETACVIRRQLDEQLMEIRELAQECGGYQKEREQKYRNGILNDIREAAVAVLDILDAPCLNRAMIRKRVEAILEMIDT